MDRVPGCLGFVGASSLERLGVEQPLMDITRRFKGIRTEGLQQYQAAQSK
jgi:predicted TIM-barrel enzyme